MRLFLICALIICSSSVVLGMNSVVNSEYDIGLPRIENEYLESDDADEEEEEEELPPLPDIPNAKTFLVSRPSGIRVTGNNSVIVDGRIVYYQPQRPRIIKIVGGRVLFDNQVVYDSGNNFNQPSTLPKRRKRKPAHSKYHHLPAVGSSSSSPVFAAHVSPSVPPPIQLDRLDSSQSTVGSPTFSRTASNSPKKRPIRKFPTNIKGVRRFVKRDPTDKEFNRAIYLASEYGRDEVVRDLQVAVNQRKLKPDVHVFGSWMKPNN